MTAIIFLVMTAAVMPSWAQYFIRNDAAPAILGVTVARPFVTSTGNVFVSEGSPIQPHQPFPQLPPQQPVFVQPQLPNQPEVFIPQDQNVSPPLPPFTFRPTSSLCNHAAKPLVDEVEDSRAYHFSWCHDSGRLYTWEQATYYCSGLGNGFQAVSIESNRKQELISRFMIAHYISDIWTSGNKRNSRSWSWLSGTSSPYSNWSSTGRRGLPQPDNEDGNEDCLAVLNNHYNDGVTWHDSSCFHLRRVICEAPRFYAQ
ncbi:lymphocyte antigen 75-like [Procambarus clarkii]|uniref:lymphocyte antigen 75-like n=1 Tax=Procambarus clarkii TaxID=6728 RepID=UPI0037437A20